MADNIDSLLARIQKEGIARAESESDQIIAQSKQKADSIVKDAEVRAATIIKNAEADTKVMVQRSEKALEQSARDVILQVREDLSSILSSIAKQETASAIKSNILEQLIIKAVDAYISGDISIQTAPDQQKAVTAMLMTKFAAKLKAGLTVKSDSSITAGFKVFEEKGRITHDFTDTAIAGTLNQLLRPALATIVNNALKNK